MLLVPALSFAQGKFTTLAMEGKRSLRHAADDAG